MKTDRFVPIKSLEQLRADENIQAFCLETTFSIAKSDDFMLCQQLAVEIALHSAATKKQHDDMAESHDAPWKLDAVNPFVGAVLLQKRGNKAIIYGCCRGAFDSDNHAEYSLLNLGLAIDQLGEDDYFFTTLEPCTQNARHPWSKSCSDILVAKQVRHIYIGLMDPNPLITGFGYRRLFETGKDHSIEIKPFCHGLRQQLVENNKQYLKQFEYGDLRIYRDIDDFFRPFLCEEAVCQFINYRLMRLVQYEPYSDGLLAFYRYAVGRGHIRKGLNGIEPFCPSKEFAMAFYKEPRIVADGATVQVVLPDGRKTYFNGPLILFYDGLPFPEDHSFGGTSFWSDLENPLAPSSIQQDLRHVILSAYSHQAAHLQYENASSKEDRDAIFDSFCHDILGIAKSEILREAVANALMHRDLESGMFVTIYLEKNEIRIVNPLPEKLRDPGMIQLLEEKKAVSNPPNPLLMRLFMDYGFGEREGLGMNEFSENDNIQIKVEGHGHQLIFSVRFDNQ